MELLLLWLVLAVLVGVFASVRRNRSGVGWAVLAVLLSPLVAGILVAILLPLSAEARAASERAARRPRSPEELAMNRKRFAVGAAIVALLLVVLALVVAAASAN